RNPIDPFAERRADRRPPVDLGYDCLDNIKIGLAERAARWLLHINQIRAAFECRQRLVDRSHADQQTGDARRAVHLLSRMSIEKKRTLPLHGENGATWPARKTKPNICGPSNQLGSLRCFCTSAAKPLAVR